MTRRWIRRSARKQDGAAFILSLFIIALIGVSAFIAYARGTREEIDRDRVTANALAQAKAALLGFAAGISLTGPERPGDLPCPDRDNDGDAELACGTEALSIGRLPWRTLGLPDLRDGNGERLWYAVSARFRNNPRSGCATPTDLGCLNSDSRGTITVRAGDDTAIADGTNPNDFVASGAIAIVIAPGPILVRQGAAQSQLRACTVGTDCDSTGRCTAVPSTDTPTCNPTNYLDVATAGSAEDNADFLEASSNGFIMGPVMAGTETIVNDRIAVISYQDLLPLLELRVAREVRNCLDEYASANNGRYPWAADTTDSGTAGNFADKSGLRAGRVPDTMEFTRTDSLPTVVSNAWPGGRCLLTTGTWWTNWKLHVFYSVAESFKPASTPPTLPCASCLIIDTAAGLVPDARYFVAVAGMRLSNVNAGQPRSSLVDRSNPANYLEGENNFTALAPPDTADWFRSRPAAGASDFFRDIAIHK